MKTQEMIDTIKSVHDPLAAACALPARSAAQEAALAGLRRAINQLAVHRLWKEEFASAPAVTVAENNTGTTTPAPVPAAGNPPSK